MVFLLVSGFGVPKLLKLGIWLDLQWFLLFASLVLVKGWDDKGWEEEKAAPTGATIPAPVRSLRYADHFDRLVNMVC